jgi:hypothetical protein
LGLYLEGFPVFLSKQFAAVMMVALTSVAMPAIAASSATSLLYQSIGTSVGSLSDSVGRSSNGSSQGGRVAGGQYKLLEVALATDQSGFVRLKIQAVAAARGAEVSDELVLSLPQAAFERSGLLAGDMILARERAYGFEFANGKTEIAFFLVLNDDTHRELASTPVVL